MELSVNAQKEITMASLLSYLNKPKQQEVAKQEDSGIPKQLEVLLEDCFLLLDGKIPPPWGIVEFEGVTYKIQKNGQTV